MFKNMHITFCKQIPSRNAMTGSPSALVSSPSSLGHIRGSPCHFITEVQAVGKSWY